MKSAAAAIVQTHKDAIGLHTHLYNGREYYMPGKPYIEGHQFYRDKLFQKGAVHYDGAWFDGVSMLYDVAQDELLVTHPGNGHPQILVKSRVASFVLHERTFIHLRTDSIANPVMRPGFYDLLFDGKVKLLVRHEKTLHERTSSTGMEGEYRDASKFYLLKDGAYHQVNNKRSVLQILKDQKKLLNKFARENKLQFRKNREDAILKVAQYYDTLQN